MTEVLWTALTWIIYAAGFGAALVVVGLGAAVAWLFVRTAHESVKKKDGR